ncbi:MAG TPA: serine hydrolase [Gemmatimonadaceae bacterium]|nr:serine hydrolase [Gemmatimonadaceae bacterium]
MRTLCSRVARGALLVGTTLVTTASAAAQQPAPPTSLASHPRMREATALLDKWLDAQRAYQRIPGLAAAAVHDQEVVWQGASGMADVERKIPATPATLYSICSISKLFTSISVMQLRDRGLVRLDDPVEKHLPWFNIRRAHPESGAITVEGLLTHASGLPREAAFPYWSAPDFTFPSRQQIIDALASEETLYPAETFFQYSNLGLTLAGEIVSTASGAPYADYVRANVLAPLGMASTYPEIPVDEKGRRMAAGYGPLTRDGTRALLPLFTSRGIAPAAGYASSALDLARFASWNFRLLAKGGTEVLAANTLREMQRVHFVDPSWETTWGLGFSVSRSTPDNKTFVGHGGSCPGFQTQLQLQLDEKVAAVAMSNGMDVNAGALSRGIYDIVSPAIKAALGDSARKLTPLDPALERYLGTYANAWRGETEVIAWEGGLAVVSLPSDTPLRGLTKLRKVGEHTFRRVRTDGKLAEPWTFSVDAAGRATALTLNYQVSPRIR